MRYLVDLSQQQAESIQRLMQAGKYPSVAQFISAAVENQIHIENDIGTVPVTKEANGFDAKNHFTPLVGLQASLTVIKGKPQTVNPPNFSELAASSYGISEDKSWLWGQTNKLLPVKVGLRALYSFVDDSQWADLEEFRKIAANIAANLGSTIKQYEKEKNKKRDDRISAGLPDNDNFKSKERYKSHFLGYMRKDGLMEGAMPFLRFVNLNRNDKGVVCIGLTKAGLQFAKLDNPSIKGTFDKSFSEEEINLYLEHISKNVPGESNAIIWLLRKLKEGVIERTKLNSEIKQGFGKIWKDASDAVINTQRAGLMARMFELELINKAKEGITVSYGISEKGEKFLKKMK